MKKKRFASKKKHFSFKSPQIMMGGILSGLLLLSTFLFIYESQRAQDPRSHADTQTVNCNVSDAEIATTAEEQQMLNLVNNHRQQNGLQPLKFSPKLNRAAAWKSKDLSAQNNFDHTDSLGRGSTARLKDCGTSGGTTGENIAYNTKPVPQTIFTDWKNSPSHNANMLDAEFKVIGIAQSGIYWTQDFSSVDDDGSVIDPTTAQLPTTGPTTVQALTTQTPPTTGPTTVPALTTPTITGPTDVIPNPGCLGSCPTLAPTSDLALVPTSGSFLSPGTISILPTSTNVSGLVELILKFLLLLFGVQTP